MAEHTAKVPPRWFIRLAWSVHRGMYRVTGGRFGLRRPKGRRWGMLRLTTVGRRTGAERNVIIAYLEDGRNLVCMAMNGWADADPAWWLNLQAHPEATVRLPGGTRRIRARPAVGAERDRLLDRWRETDDDFDAYTAMRSRETAIVVLEPAA
ncbi:deazaflavin-dependent oxidoreductase (nitroreductase family) [Stackebrandtia albiflava]|uniref:Deazaflavin-dependent oxidoreductase (Nitroreductase family) n=1 Tax=Stackebrandtia albiflava TaxID=406432 RepID=A0A562V237_9ACTN|nr:nitroreductase/quinone reductase family protein [Stackebrandtia albiflava]TWJ11980.1 deazaflavin-dependent oxidoreductase (nitroreductase family) [Stackebrandtia albiflava]